MELVTFSWFNLHLNESNVWLWYNVKQNFAPHIIIGTDEMFEGGEKDFWFTHTHAQSEKQKNIPVLDFGQTFLKPLWKWCGLGVKEVNAQIETLDHRWKT